MNNNTELQTIEPTKIVDWKTPKVPAVVREQIQNLVRRTHSKATDQEIDDFIYYSASINLNPLKKQIYAIPRGGKLTYQISIDGLRAIAHRTGEYTGCDSIPIYDKEGKLIAGQCTVTRNGNPFTARVSMKEYSSGENTWKSIPETMICKVAEAHALRKAFPEECGRLYTQEEFNEILDRKKNVPDISNIPKLEAIESKSDPSLDENMHKFELEQLAAERKKLVEYGKTLKLSAQNIADQFSDKWDIYKEFEENREYDRARAVIDNIRLILEDQSKELSKTPKA